MSAPQQSTSQTNPSQSIAASLPQTPDLAEHRAIAELDQTALKKLIDSAPSTDKRITAPNTDKGLMQIEVSSWSQVPAILQKLQAAGSNESGMRLKFPNQNDAAIRTEQAAIREFLVTYHSKPIPEMFEALKNHLTTSVVLKDSADSTRAEIAKNWVDSFHLDSKDNMVLKTTHVVEVKSSTPKATLKEQIIERVAACGKDGEVIFQIADIDKQQIKLAECLNKVIAESTIGDKAPSLSHCKVWIGRSETFKPNGPQKPIEEISVEDFLKRMEKAKQTAIDNSSTGTAPLTAGGAFPTPQASATEVSVPNAAPVVSTDDQPQSAPAKTEVKSAEGDLSDLVLNHAAPTQPATGIATSEPEAAAVVSTDSQQQSTPAKKEEKIANEDLSDLVLSQAAPTPTVTDNATNEPAVVATNTVLISEPPMPEGEGTASNILIQPGQEPHCQVAPFPTPGISIGNASSAPDAVTVVSTNFPVPAPAPSESQQPKAIESQDTNLSQVATTPPASPDQGNMPKPGLWTRLVTWLGTPVFPESK